MAKQTVRRLTYYSFQIIFHSLCLSGLIWQITQISINFFKFDVTKDINIFTPEETDYSSKVVYICFSNVQIADKERLSRYHVRVPNIPLKERFDMTPPGFDIFVMPADMPNDELILGDRYCYQYSFKYFILESFHFHQHVLEHMTLFELSLGHIGYSLDQKRLIMVEFQGRNEIYRFKSNSYSVTKLESPYSDHCFNYHNIGFQDRQDAAAECAGTKSKVSVHKITPKSIYQFSNASLKMGLDNYKKCFLFKFWKSDCDTKLYLTQLAVIDLKNISETFIQIVPDTEASFSVVSKPRIDNIDYVTYILGALGSWIGFSFIGINPIPHLFRIDTGDNNPINYYSNMKFIRRELMQMKRESIKMKQHISILERKLKK